MTASDLDAVVAVAGHERYRYLTSDVNPDAESREGYRRLVREKAEALAGLPPPRPAVPNAYQIQLQQVRECPHAGPASCGCNAVRRCAIYNRDVAIEQCLRCVRDGGLEG